MHKKLIIITGASSGIGFAMAKLFGDAGFSLGLIARRTDALKSLNLPHSLCLPVDVGDNHELKKAIQIIEQEFGPVDCLINNAGFSKDGDFLEINHTD